MNVWVEILKNTKSLTAQYINKKKEIKTSDLRETLICKKNKTSHLIDIFFVKTVSIKSCVT